MKTIRVGFLLVFSLVSQCAELSLDPVTTAAGASVPLALRFSALGSMVAALQFDLDYDTALTLTSNAGAAALSAGKDLYSAPVSSRRTRFLAAGINRNILSDGVVVTINAFVNAGTASGVYPLRLTNVHASDQAGNEIPLSNRDGSLTVNTGAAQPVSGVFAQVASGGGWKTTFSLLNLASTPQQAKLTFWDDAGAPLTVPLVFSPELGLAPTSGSAAEVTIPANGLAVVDSELSPLAAVAVGWARIRAPAGIVGSATFRYRLAEGQDTEAVVPMETRTPSSFVLPFDNTAGFVAGVAVANDSDVSPAQVAVTIRDAAGKELLSDALDLPVRGHGYFALTTRYPSLVGARGSIEFRELNGGSIAVLGLRFSPSGSFTSIPAETK